MTNICHSGNFYDKAGASAVCVTAILYISADITLFRFANTICE